MKDLSLTFNVITDSFKHYRMYVLSYIHYRIGNKDDAEDLVQDVFLRLMEYDKIINKDSVKYLIFTIAQNIINDYLRREYKSKEILNYLTELSYDSNSDIESLIIAEDLSIHEKLKLSTLPPQRRNIYILRRFYGKSSSEIASKLCLSKKTVDNHLLISRREVREYMKQCI